MKISAIFSQDRAINSLRKAYSSDRMGHSYIFCGADGVGKFTTASAWAKMLLCENKIESTSSEIRTYDSCGKCKSCTVFDGGAHPDLNVIYKELSKYTKNGKGKTTPVDLPKDVITEFLIDKAFSKPKMADYSVYIVKEAQRLNPSSQNALLKVLEEPPSYCVIILLCNSLEKLLPTIKSRCQILRFGEIDENIIVEKLVQMSVAHEEAVYWARFCESSLGKAITWSALNVDKTRIYELKKEFIRKITGLTLADCVDVGEWMGKTSKKISKAVIADTEEDSASTTDINRKAAKLLIRMAMSAYSDVMRLSVGDTENLINIDQQHEIETLAARIGPEKAADKISKAYENMMWVDASVNEKLNFEELLIFLSK